MFLNKKKNTSSIIEHVLGVELLGGFPSPPGTVTCTPGARTQLLENRERLRIDKVHRKVDYISYKADGGTHFEENRLSKKKRIFLYEVGNVSEYKVFSSRVDSCEYASLLNFFHPCIRNEKLIRDMAIDLQNFMSRNTKRHKLLGRLCEDDNRLKNTRLYALESIKFDGEDHGIPITHVYSTRAFHPGNVSKQNTSVKTYARFDFIEAMYISDDSEEMIQGIVSVR